MSINLGFGDTPEIKPNTPADTRNPEQLSRAQDSTPLDNTKGLYGNVTNWTDGNLSVVSDAAIHQVRRGERLGDADAIVLQNGVTYNVYDSGATSRPEIDVEPRLLGSYSGTGANCLKFGDLTNVIVTQGSATEISVRLSGPLQSATLYRDVAEQF
jgi:hypothetical protein